MNQCGIIKSDYVFRLDSMINFSVGRSVDAQVNYEMNEKTYGAIKLHVYKKIDENLESPMWFKVLLPIYEGIKLKNKKYENTFKTANI